jgi:D-cysteine desulfhydrase
VAAVICPQPRTNHAERMLRLTAASGAELSVVGSMAAVPIKTVRVLRRGDYLVPPGGSNVLGTLGYLRAVEELVQQVRDGQLSEPDIIVAPLGSGGTVAGLLAGVLREGLRARIVGVEVATAPAIGRAMVLALSAAALRRDGGSPSLMRLRRQLEVDGRFLGAGYGAPTAAGEQAAEAARSAGLELDPTYTAKAFARVLEVAETPRPSSAPLRVLYWHTLNAAPLEPLLSQAPSFDDLPRKLQKLLSRAGPGTGR